MLVLFMGLGVFFVVRTVKAAASSLSSLPRSNADWIWY
jgi:hypothetical protein